MLNVPAVREYVLSLQVANIPLANQLKMLNDTRDTCKCELTVKAGEYLDKQIGALEELCK